MDHVVRSPSDPNFSPCIALLSNYDRKPVDPPSEQRFGRYADRETVRRSGLWNVDHVTAMPTPETLTLVRSVMAST